MSNARAFLIILGFFSNLSQAGLACDSNVTLVDESYYVENLDFKSKKEFSSLPNWVPVDARKMFNDAEQLLISASEEEVKSIFISTPAVSSLLGLEKYSLEIKEPGYDYTLQITRYKGCVSRIFLHVYFSEGENKGDVFGFFIYFITPDGATRFGKINRDACQINIRKRQEILLTIDENVPKKYAVPIEGYPVYLYKLFRAFDYKRERVFKVIGKPTHASNNRMEWKLIGEDQLQYTVDLKSYKNCVKQLDISWADSNGKKFTLSKTNYH